jgi:hypothetical protein
MVRKQAQRNAPMNAAPQTNTTPESFVTMPRFPVANPFEGYGALVKREYASPQMWLDVLNEMQRASARWYARRQDAIREAGSLLSAPPGQAPQDVAQAWGRFAAASAQRAVEDLSDQMQTGLKAAMYLAPGATRTAEALSALRANGSSTPH